jgi:hypothetical protein
MKTFSKTTFVKTDIYFSRRAIPIMRASIAKSSSFDGSNILQDS